ncbi:hypothetical protein LIA77_11550 [Sarocladium implicatum]|nr:hypothetical protein LIA77_11550 [Sarocladium implicatum]
MGASSAPGHTPPGGWRMHVPPFRTHRSPQNDGGRRLECVKYRAVPRWIEIFGVWAPRCSFSGYPRPKPRVQPQGGRWRSSSRLTRGRFTERSTCQRDAAGWRRR